jgi:hypothetical protein
MGNGIICTEAFEESEVNRSQHSYVLDTTMDI